VVIRLMGLILLALSVEFIAGGLKGLFPALA
jgi:small neutral amino acid transporter SnatA (MarC family)